MINSNEQLKQPIRQLNKNGRPQGMHPNSLKNLRPNKDWVKGQSGNPTGRKLTPLLNEELARIPSMEEDGFDGKGRPNDELMIRSQVRDARCGDNAARKEIWDRIEGRVTLSIGGEGGKPIGVELDGKGKLLDAINRFIARTGEAESNTEPDK